MYKKYKRLVCTHPDLLARFSKVNLSNTKIRPDLFSKNFFPRLIYCGQEPLLLLNVTEDDCQCYFLGVHVSLSTRCKICFPQKSHECARKLTALWITSLFLVLKYKFINGSFAFSPG